MALGHATIGLIFAVAAHAQPASITTTAQPVFGPVVFDSAGNLYYAGNGGPITAGAAQTQPGGGTCTNEVFPIGLIPEPCPDANITKVDASGNVIFGTLLGGPTADLATAMALDSSGDVYVIGSTKGSFPTTPGSANGASTVATAFAAKLSADGSHFLYSTYLPDTAATAAAIAVDAQGNAYIGGKSTAGHAYVVKLSADGSTFLYNASLAGSGQESAGALVADAAGNVVVAGTTSSPDFPVSAGAVQSRLAGAQNAFAAGLDTAGHVAFSTYLGGSGTDTPAVLQTDGAGNIFVAGATSSLDFPTTPGSFQASPVVPLWNNGAPAGFIAKLSANGGTLLYASYVMSADGGLQTGVASLAVTASGEAYIAGVTGAGFPVTPSAPQPCFEGPTADFVAHLDPRGVLLDSTFVGKNTNFAFGLGVQGDGSLLFAWHASGPNSLSRIRFGGAGWTAPACLSSWALNAATMSSGDGGLALGEMVTFTGFGIGPEIGVAYQPDAHGQIPRSLAGVQVLFDRQPAPVLYAQSQQVNVVAPSQISGTGFTIVSLVYNGVTVGSMTVPVDVAAPGIFRLQPGVSSQAAAVNQDGSVNGPANPAPAGSVVAIWVTGIGPLAIPCAGGGMNLPDAVSMADGWSVQIFDGRRTPAQFAGNAPGLPCGVQQVNFVVPEYAQSLYRFALVSTDGQSGVMGSVFATIAVR